MNAQYEQQSAAGLLVDEGAQLDEDIASKAALLLSLQEAKKQSAQPHA